MAGITQPFDFRRHLRRSPATGLDPVPYLDLVLIAVFLALNVSAFVIAPGSQISLPRSASEGFAVTGATAVLTVDRNELLFFQGAKLSEAGLLPHFQEYLAGRSRHTEGTLLLIKADASIEAQVLFNLMDLAREAGFTKVHLAAEFNRENRPETMVPFSER